MLVLSVIYISVMLYLMLFGRIGTVKINSYTEYLRTHTFIIPLKFIYDYIISIPTDGIYNFRLRNIIGNTVLFIPPGIFLPYFFKKLRSVKKLIPTFAVIIFIIELLQLFTALGTFDIDDILLNCLGAYAGFCIYKKTKDTRLSL